MILISSNGLSVLLTFTFSMLWTTSSPDSTRPNIVCFLSSQGVVVVVIKNWDPLVPGPAFAILTVYGLMMCQRQLQIHRYFNQPVMPKIVVELILKLSAPNGRSTRAIPERVPRLDHELGNDTMKDDAFKVATPRMCDKVLHGLGRLLREQAHVDISDSCMYGGGVCEGRRPRFAYWCGGGHRLFLASWLFIEHISITALVVSVELC